jgi:predicted peptidase
MNEGVIRSWRSASLALSLCWCLSACGGGGSPAAYETTPVFGSWLYSVSAPGTSWGFYLYLPDDYASSGEDYPLVVYLQGWGNFGWTPNPMLLGSGPLWPLRASDTALDPTGRDRLDPHVRRSIVITPRLPYYDPTYRDRLGYYHPDTLQRVIEYVEGSYRVDRTRLYVTGASEGGGGTWALAWRHPEEIAAAVPVSGALSYPMVDGLREVPIWIFHSFDDGAVPYTSGPNAAFAAVTGQSGFFAGYPHAAGDPRLPAASDYTIGYTPGVGLTPWTPGVVSPTARITYTLFATGGHDAWTRAYANPELWSWMFAQSRSGPPQARPPDAAVERLPLEPPGDDAVLHLDP